MADEPNQDKKEQGGWRWLPKSEAKLPFDVVETTEEQKRHTWKQLKKEGRGVPLVIGDAERLEEYQGSKFPRSETKRILRAADRLIHPRDLVLYELEKRREWRKWRAENPDWKGFEGVPAIEPRVPTHNIDFNSKELDLTDAETAAALTEELGLPDVGEWPSEKEELTRGTTIPDRTKIYTILIPTDDPTSIPAHIQWGGWNECPDAEYHVAALRSWRDRFGAELVSIEHDTVKVFVERPPRTRKEALDLALEQYIYCNDIGQTLGGEGTLSELAADLIGSSWWIFWWD